jgi:hypothetical protein
MIQDEADHCCRGEHRKEEKQEVKIEQTAKGPKGGIPGLAEQGKIVVAA